MDLLRPLVFILGLAIVARAVFSAIQTFVLPRGANDRLSRLVFSITFGVFRLSLRKTRTYEQRDRIMAFLAPIGLLALIPIYLILIFLGFAGMYWALGQVGAWEQALKVSVNAELTAKAKAVELDFSQELEAKLAEQSVAAQCAKRLSENAAAIEAYNDRVAKGKILSEVAAE